MTRELQIFEHPKFGGIRIADHDGRPWFVARDIAMALGYQDPADAIQRHCKKANDFNVGISPDGVPAPKIIPESDVYRLVMRSKLPSAEIFQDWVVEEVLPAIRKTGTYTIKPKPDPNARSLAITLRMMGKHPALRRGRLAALTSLTASLVSCFFLRDSDS